MRKPKVVSLFSGAGGLDIGFKKAGFHTVFATDVCTCVFHQICTYGQQ